MKQNEPMQMSQNIGVCDKCKGTGYYFYTDERGYDFAKECECGIVSKQKQERMLAFANIPRGLVDYKLKNFRTDVYKSKDSKANINVAIKAIKYWLENVESMVERGKGLYIFSSTKGSGKTRLAVSLANELMEKYKYTVKFATTVQIINEIKATWDSDKSESTLLKQLIETDILVIDDFGAEDVKGWVSERFYHVINGRYVDRKPTIFTSNANLEQLEYDDRISNRIKETCFLIPFPEESVRDHIAEANKYELVGGLSNDT